MKSTLEPTHQSTCMKCRAASARYHGKWAAEGLCRACVSAMSPEIRLKVLRDMHPEDRKRWQLDGLLSTRDEQRRATTPQTREPSEQELSRLLEAVEKGGEEALRDCAATVGAKVAVEPDRPPRRGR